MFTKHNPILVAIFPETWDLIVLRRNRIGVRFGWERSLKAILFHPFCCGQGYLPLDQGLHSPSSLALNTCRSLLGTGRLQHCILRVLSSSGRTTPALTICLHWRGVSSLWSHFWLSSELNPTASSHRRCKIPQLSCFYYIKTGISSLLKMTILLKHLKKNAESNSQCLY